MAPTTCHAANPPSRDLEALNAIAEALNTAPDVAEGLQRALARVAELLGLRTGWIWLVDPETGQFYSAAALGLPPYLQEPVHMTGHACWCLQSLSRGDLTPKNIDVMECSRLRSAVQAGEAEQTRGLRYHASIPLYFQGRPLGVMNLTGPSWRSLTGEELRLLSTIAYQAGIAVERARLAEQGVRLARAEERTRLAREIHDTLAQSLTAIALHVESALRHLRDDPDQGRQRLERALAIAREGLEDARRSVLDLRTAALAGRPLGEALAALARGFTSETGVRVQLHAADGLTLPLRVEAELFRIAQEALANVRAHAHAHAVEVRLRSLSQRVQLAIRDDGQGFDPAAVSGDHHGLAGIRERARLLGGQARIHSRPGRGTTILVSAPLQP